jgi:hypothetical protein
MSAAGSPDLCYPTNPLYADIVDQYEAEHVVPLIAERLENALLQKFPQPTTNL